MRLLGILPRAHVALLVAVASLAVTAAGARADVFEGSSLASIGMLEGRSIVEQANVAEHPAISGDGRYVAFDGEFGGVSGVWRRDLQTGAIEQVAGGDAQLPSISEDGRYVSFTTNEGGSLAAITDGLRDENPEKKAVNVYVRDMSKRAGEEGAFVIASAPSGSDEPLTYTYEAGQLEDEFGAVAAGRSAMSADGRYVAFVTTAESNLAGPGTPRLQVAVRDLRSKETKLVSVEYANGITTARPVPIAVEGGTVRGAVFGTEGFPASPGARGALAQGASISADGSTVAWIGQEIDKQAPTLAGIEQSQEYVEPLWRRIAGGPQEPTRRITGGGDPANPACAASGETEPLKPRTLSDPCQGPFEPVLEKEAQTGVFAAAAATDIRPQLSADGRTVAFLASQRFIADGNAFTNIESTDDLYVIDMADGLTRTQATRRLTELGGDNPQITGAFAPITDLGISPDGRQIAFSTERTAFPLGSPAFVSPIAAKPEMQEVYDVDLANDTLSRVTHGYQGEDQQSEPRAKGPTGASSPSFSANGNTIAFSSQAANLVFGENNRASSAFVVSRKQFASEAPTQYISPPPGEPNTQPAWLLNATAHSRRDGRVVLEVEVPGAGRLSASATSAVRVTIGSRSARRGGRRGHGSRRRRTSLVARNVAVGSKAAGGEGLITLVLSLKPAYNSLASHRGGLPSTVSLSFTASGHRPLHARLPAAFVRKSRAAKHASGSRRPR